MPACSAARTSLACSTALRGVGAQPVVGIVPVDEALDLLLRPVGDGGAEGGLGGGDALARGELRVPARHHRLGLVVEPAQQLALPAVPDAGPDGADVGDRQHQQQLQPLRALHDVGEVADGLGIADVAAEGDLAHQSGGARSSQATVSVSAALRPKRGHKRAGDARARRCEWSSLRPLAMSCRKAAT